MAELKAIFEGDLQVVYDAPPTSPGASRQPVTWGLAAGRGDPCDELEAGGDLQGDSPPTRSSAASHQVARVAELEPPTRSSPASRQAAADRSAWEELKADQVVSCSSLAEAEGTPLGCSSLGKGSSSSLGSVTWVGTWDDQVDAPPTSPTLHFPRASEGDPRLELARRGTWSQTPSGKPPPLPSDSSELLSELHSPTASDGRAENCLARQFSEEQGNSLSTSGKQQPPTASDGQSPQPQQLPSSPLFPPEPISAFSARISLVNPGPADAAPAPPEPPPRPSQDSDAGVPPSPPPRSCAPPAPPPRASLTAALLDGDGGGGDGDGATESPPPSPQKAALKWTLDAEASAVADSARSSPDSASDGGVGGGGDGGGNGGGGDGGDGAHPARLSRSPAVSGIPPPKKISPGTLRRRISTGLLSQSSATSPDSSKSSSVLSLSEKPPRPPLSRGMSAFSGMFSNSGRHSSGSSRGSGQLPWEAPQVPIQTVYR